MPAGEGASTEDEFLNADVGRVFRLELDPVAVEVDRLVEVRRRDQILRRDSGPGQSVSHGHEGSDHRNSGNGSNDMYASDLHRRYSFRDVQKSRGVTRFRPAALKSPRGPSRSVGTR